MGHYKHYWLMPKSWYQKTAHSLVNKLLSTLCHNRLSQQQYDLLKTSLIFALSTYNLKMKSVTPMQKVTSCHAYYNLIIKMGFTNLVFEL